MIFIRLIYLLSLVVMSFLGLGNLLIYVFMGGVWFLLFKNEFRAPQGAVVFFLFLYALYYPSHLMLMREYNEYVEEAMHLHVLGISFFMIGAGLLKCIGPATRNTYIPSARTINHSSPGVNVSIIKVFLVVLYFMYLLYLLIVLNLDVESKSQVSELIESNAILRYLSLVSILYSALLVLYLANVKSLKNDSIYYASLVLFLLAFGVVGERDLIFRLFFVSLLLLFDGQYRFYRIYYIILLLLIFVGLPFTQALKGVFIGGANFEFSIDDIFVGEFISASRNTSKILEFWDGSDYGGVSVLLNDIYRFVGYENNAELGRMSTARWYDREFRELHGFSSNSGWGFSMVAYFYMLGKNLGVAVGFMMLGAISQILYINRCFSKYHRAFYLIFVASLIYCIRADMANFLALTIKFGLLPLVLYYSIAKFLKSIGKKEVEA